VQPLAAGQLVHHGVAPGLRVGAVEAGGDRRQAIQAGVEIGVAAFDEAVGVPQQHGAGRDDNCGFGAGLRCGGQRTGPPVVEEPGGVVGDQQRRRVARACVAQPAGGRVVLAVADGGESRPRDGRRRPVERVEDRGRAVVRRVGQDAQCRLQPSHGGGGAQVVADDVADGEPDPAAGQGEGVVPVAADVVVLVGRAVAAGELRPGQFVGHDGQEGLLQLVGRLPLLLVQPRPVQRRGHELGERAGHRGDVAVDRALVGELELQCPERRAGGPGRHCQRGRRPGPDGGMAPSGGCQGRWVVQRHVGHTGPGRRPDPQPGAVPVDHPDGTGVGQQADAGADQHLGDRADGRGGRQPGRHLLQGLHPAPRRGLPPGHRPGALPLGDLHGQQPGAEDRHGDEQLQDGGLHLR
jgi:hypothetical protein